MDAFIKKRNKDLFARAKERLGKAGKGSLDVIYTTHNESAGADRTFFFLTGIEAGHFIYAAAAVHKDGTAQLFIQELEEAEAKHAGLPYTIIRPAEETLFKALKGNKYVGVNAGGITLAEAGRFKDKRIQLVNIADEIMNARAVKSPSEIDRTRKAARIAAQTAAAIPTLIEGGMTEKALAARIDFEMAKRGSEGPSFSTIVAFGENSAIPHATPTERALKPGDLILCDFGGTYAKLSSDITRVFVLGPANEFQKSLYGAILKIQERALAELKVGAGGRALHDAAAGAVDEFFLKLKAPGKMGHGLGHSIGYYTHDGKRLGLVDYKIPDGFVTTVEPAGYLPGIGGVRIEDMALVTRDGVENLTKEAPKEKLIEIFPRST